LWHLSNLPWLSECCPLNNGKIFGFKNAFAAKIRPGYRQSGQNKKDPLPTFGSTILSTDGFNISAYFGLNLK
jgi:hypothetical protein